MDGRIGVRCMGKEEIGSGIAESVRLRGEEEVKLHGKRGIGYERNRNRRVNSVGKGDGH